MIVWKRVKKSVQILSVLVPNTSTMTYQKFLVNVISSELIGCEEVAGTFV
jgi:hypothetical protein